MIEVLNLHYTYPDGTTALRGISLTIRDGEFLLVCGLNGSGKTTLIRAISSLLRPTEGTIRVNGLDVLRSPKDVRRLVGMVFQDADCQIIGETVEEDVTFGPENLGLSSSEIRERVDWALRLMGLEEVSEKPCYLLSGGEKRRLSIASVLAMKPRILLFDEPFTHLDYPGIREVVGYMTGLHGQGHTLVVATHDVEKVIDLVDRVAILDKGRLVALGSPEEVGHELTRLQIVPPLRLTFGRGSWPIG